MFCQIQTTFGRRIILGLFAVAAVLSASIASQKQANAQEGVRYIKVFCQAGFNATFNVRYRKPDGQGRLTNGYSTSEKMSLGKRVSIPVPTSATEIKITGVAHTASGRRIIDEFDVDFNKEYKIYGTIFKPAMKAVEIENLDQDANFVKLASRAGFIGRFKIDYDVPNEQGVLEHVQRTTKNVMAGQNTSMAVPKNAVNIKVSGYLINGLGAEVGVKTLNVDFGREYTLRGGIGNPSMVPQ